MEYPNEDLLDAYLDNTLPPLERAEFEATLGRDQRLRNDLEQHRSARDIIEVAALKAVLGRIHSNATAEREVPTIAPDTRQKGVVKPLYSFRAWHAIAAVLVFGLGVTTWRMMSGGSEQALYSKYYTQDAGLPGLMGNAANYTLDDAMVDYKSGQYAEAIRKLRTLQQQGIAGDTAAYYLGMAYLGSKKYEEAGKILRPLTQKENTFRTKAVWYQALTDMRLNKKEVARKELQAIASDSASLKADAARELLSELK